MAARYALARASIAALFTCSTAIAACEDRSAPDDVPHTQSGGIARVPTVGVGSSVGDVGAGAGGGSGVSGGPQGTGASGAAGRGGTGGSAGIPGTSGTGGSAGIPGTSGQGGSAGIPAPFDGTTGGGVPSAFGNAAPGAADTAGAGGALGIGGSVGGVGTNLAPTASFTISPECISDVQTAVTLASSSVDADGDSLRCSWVVPSAVPSSSEDCTVTVTFFDPVESPVELFVNDGSLASSATAMIATCPGVAAPNPPAVP